ncbi:hypothetical protein IMSAGC012_01668 [Lachnospiraceae bacterium]|nr:hypothetical protein IMSAGC012_01668 [Lachnospiraceae bacterium]
MNVMEDNRAEQKEALEVLIEFNDRVLKNMNIIVKELSGERLEDTNQFLKGIVDALNWEIEVVNGTMGLLNEGKERIQKDAFNAAVLRLGDAIKANEDTAMAEAISALIPMFENLGAAAREVTA